MDTELEFADRTVLVTGATGNLGRVVAGAFAARGANLGLLDRSVERLEGSYGKASEKRLYLPTDLLDAAQVEAAVKAAMDRFGRVDVLCDIAGGFRMGSPVHATSDSDWNFMLDHLNLLRQTATIAFAIRALGTLTILFALVWGIINAKRPTR